MNEWFLLCPEHESEKRYKILSDSGTLSLIYWRRKLHTSFVPFFVCSFWRDKHSGGIVSQVCHATGIFSDLPHKENFLHSNIRKKHYLQIYSRTRKQSALEKFSCWFYRIVKCLTSSLMHMHIALQLLQFQTGEDTQVSIEIIEIKLIF